MILSAALTRSTRLTPRRPVASVVDVVACRHCDRAWTLARFHSELRLDSVDVVAQIERRWCRCGGIVAFAWEAQ